MRIPFGFSAVMVATSLVLWACGGDDGGDDGGSGSPATPAADEGQHVEVAISAATGGEIVSPSGTGKLTIPAGALAADTTITLDVKAASEGSVASVYDLGPDGTTFAAPATLSIAFDGQVPEGKKAALAVLENGAWKELPGSSLAGGKVTGPVSHFSHFSVILVDGEAVLQSECSDVAEAFQPCGGDPTGTWTIEEICAPEGAIGGDPFQGRCPDARLGADLEVDGTVTFADGKFTPETTQTVHIEMHVPKSCLNGQPCSAIEGDDGQTSCAETGDACECVRTDVRSDDADDVEDFAVEGNEIVLTDEDGDVDRLRFCVQGNRLTVEVKGDDPGDPTLYYTGTK